MLDPVLSPVNYIWKARCKKKKFPEKPFIRKAVIIFLPVMQSKAFDLQVLTLNCRMQKQTPALLEKKVGEHLKKMEALIKRRVCFC